MIRLETSKASIRSWKRWCAVRTATGGCSRRTPVLWRAYRALVAQAYPDRQHDAPDMRLHKAIFEYLEGPWWKEPRHGGPQRRATAGRNARSSPLGCLRRATLPPAPRRAQQGYEGLCSGS
jgi:hypothetical protein